MSDKKIYADVKMVSIEKIKPSTFENANEFSEELFASLKKDIETNGLIGQALIVNPKDYTLIDGHHRLKCLKQLGFSEAPCIFYEPADEIEHKILSVALNKKRGTLNEQRLHDLVKSIHDSGRYSLEELSEKLGFNNSEIIEKLESIKIDENLIRKLEDDARLQESSLPVLITFSVKKESIGTIEEALGQVGKMLRGESLVDICESYLKQNSKNDII